MTMPMGSFPLWERGLKYDGALVIEDTVKSFPLWERGLKSNGGTRGMIIIPVVPLVGTWIEIF